MRAWGLPAVAAVALLLGVGAAPAAAQSKACREDLTPTYTDPCGPTYTLPGWGDAGGWKQPEQYETIQLADVDGDGDDELLARTPTGVVINDFNKDLGEWGPQTTPVTTGGVESPTAVVLSAFANPGPRTTFTPPPPAAEPAPTLPATNWTLPQYYDTIQAADIDADGRAEVLGRSAAGVIVYDYTPASGGTPAAWRQVTTSGPLPDSDHWGDSASYYATIQTGDVNGDRRADLVARGSTGLVAYSWTGSGWRTLVGAGSNMFPDPAFTAPQYWSSVQLADIDGDGRDEALGRTVTGVVAYEVMTGDRVDGFDNGPFGDVTGATPDCPFAPTPSHCLGYGPAYYSTLQFADVDGSGGAELVARASDGVRVRRYQGDSPDAWGRLATLTDLADANGFTDQSRWETIQFADINGDKRAEALARDDRGISAWTYDRASRTWRKLTPTTALALADDPWASDRSYYSTIQTGDVDGDRRADVIARGPYGIRTWFYNRRNTGGWERYLPEGYTDFPSRPCTGGATPPCGELAAYNRMNDLAGHAGDRGTNAIPGGGTTLRSVWLGSTVPTTQDLNDLRDLVVGPRVATCTNLSQNNPDRYATCAPPAGDSSFTAAEWTSVANELLAEAYWASQSVQYFAALKAAWDEMYKEQSALLPVLGNQLRNAGLDSTWFEKNFTLQEIYSVAFGIFGAVLTIAAPEEVGAIAVFWILSEAVTMIPSSSPDTFGSLESSYDNLEAQLNTRIEAADDYIAQHTKSVLHDEALSQHVGFLRAQRTWQFDAVDVTSAARQGFVLWVYQELLPTLWSRYVITSCHPVAFTVNCNAPDTGPWMQGTSENFTAVRAAPRKSNIPSQSTPCDADLVGGHLHCDYRFAAPADLISLLWDPQDRSCVYPGTWDESKKCSLGIDPRTLLADPATVSMSQRWDFNTYVGDPMPPHLYGGALAGSVSGIGATSAVGTRARDAAAAGTRRTRSKATVRLRATLALPRRLRLRRARIEFDQMLFERGGARELVRRRMGRKLPPLMLSRRGTGGAFVARRRGAGPRVLVRLRNTGRRLVSLRLVARNVSVPSEPVACNGTRPGVDFATEPIRLHTRLRIHDGRRRPATVSLPAHWECRRDRFGALRRLVLKRPRVRRPHGRSAALTVRGPRRVTAGGRATYRITARNRSGGRAHDLRTGVILPRGLSAPQVRGARRGGRLVLWRRPTLRAGRATTVRLPLRVARSAPRRVCLRIAVGSTYTRTESERICSRVVARGRRR